MEITGTVVSVKDGIAEVMIIRTSACGHSCETCGACAGKEHILRASGAAGYAAGETVRVEVSDRAPLGEAFAVYILPILAALIFCALAAALLGGKYAWAGLLPAAAVWGVTLAILNRRARSKRVNGRVVGRG